MNVLLIVDEYPFPPRNGVTVPIANFAMQLASANCKVDMLWFDLESSRVPVQRADGGSIGELIRIPMERQGLLRRAIAECTGIAPAFSAWSPIGELPVAVRKHYDLAWASPIRAFGLWLAQREALGVAADRTWAVINDSYTLSLLELAKRQRTWGSRLLYRLRARGMKVIEPRLLTQADTVAVQSAREIEFFRRAFADAASPRLLELKNGVSDALFAQRSVPVRDLLFVGTLDAFYKPTLQWFIREVYAQLPEPRPAFTVVGRGAEAADLHLFEKLGIEYQSFIDDIASAYLSSSVLVAPIFKGYGTINKVLEGMAAGCVVIGDTTAFNGIAGFVPGRHGIVANTREEFVVGISSALADPAALSAIGAEARELMRREFSWGSRLDTVLRALE